MKAVHAAASSAFDKRTSGPPFFALVTGFPSGLPAAPIPEVFAPAACVLRQTAHQGLVAVLRFGSLDEARVFQARWEGQRFPAAEVARHAPSTGAPDRYLRVRNGAQQLFAAALHGQSEGVELLLSAGVSANGYKDEYGCSPLHAAARQGSPRIVQMLIDAQAHLDAKSRLGTTPLAEASTHQRADAVERLLAAGARVAELDRWGRHAALAGVFVPEEDRWISEMLLGNERPTAQDKRKHVTHARLAHAATDAAARRHHAEQHRRSDAQHAQAEHALDGERLREAETRRYVNPTAYLRGPAGQAEAAGVASDEHSARERWHAQAQATAQADAFARAPGGAERLSAREGTARAEAMGRALWSEGMAGVNPEIYAGRHLRTHGGADGRGGSHAARPQSAAAPLVASAPFFGAGLGVGLAGDEHRQRSERISALGMARTDAIRQAGHASLAARSEAMTELQLELNYLNPLTGVGDCLSVAPANDLVWCERDGWVAKNVPRVNRAAYHRPA